MEILAEIAINTAKLLGGFAFFYIVIFVTFIIFLGLLNPSPPDKLRWYHFLIQFGFPAFVWGLSLFVYFKFIK